MNSTSFSLVILACLSTGFAILPVQANPMLFAVPRVQIIAQSPRSPTSAKDYFNRGDGYAMSGDYQKAIADYTEAIIRLNPNNPNLAGAYTNLHYS